MAVPETENGVLEGVPVQACRRRVSRFRRQKKGKVLKNLTWGLNNDLCVDKCEVLKKKVSWRVETNRKR